QRAHLQAINSLLRRVDKTTQATDLDLGLLMVRVDRLASSQEMNETLAEGMAEFLRRSREQETVRDKLLAEIADRMLKLEDRLFGKIDESTNRLSGEMRQNTAEIKGGIDEAKRDIIETIEQRAGTIFHSTPAQLPQPPPDFTGREDE